MTAEARVLEELFGDEDDGPATLGVLNLDTAIAAPQLGTKILEWCIQLRPCDNEEGLKWVLQEGIPRTRERFIDKCGQNTYKTKNLRRPDLRFP